MLVAELAHWSLEERERVQGEPGDALRRVATIALLALAGLVAAALVLAVADAARTGGLAIDLLGAVAAAAVLLVVLLGARRSGREAA